MSSSGKTIYDLRPNNSNILNHNQASNSDDVATRITPAWVVFFVCCMCTMLLLLYFFFNQLGTLYVLRILRLIRNLSKKANNMHSHKIYQNNFQFMLSSACSFSPL